MTTVIVEKRAYAPPTLWRRTPGAGLGAIHALRDAKIFKSRVEEALETCMYDAAHRIRKHPFVSVAAALAVGVPLGALVAWVSTRRGQA
jgi:hypothetical protein